VRCGSPGRGGGHGGVTLPSMGGVSPTPLRGLLIDWGGVLTAPLEAAMRQWAADEGIDYGHYRSVLHRWSDPGETDPMVHQVERGQVATEDFEASLAAALSQRGAPVAAAGLLDRMLGGLERLEDDMLTLVRRARAAGIRTALVSNSWGEHYPDALWDNLFDAVVISRRVGLRKPDRAIFDHSAEVLGLANAECVLVDDLAGNIHGAVAAGMVAVHHVSYERSVAELEVLFGVPLRASSREVG